MSAEELLRSAASALKKKDSSTAVRALEDALVVVRKDAPLEVRALVVVNHDHTGIGLYTPAKGDVVDGRRIRFYVELANHAHSEISKGLWRVQLDVTGDFSFDDAKERLALQSGVSLGTQSYETRTPVGVTSFGVDVKLGEKSPAGTYHMLLHVTDAVSGKTAKQEARFVLV